MILAVLDDLMFSSKIRAAATAAGTTASFARSRDAALAAVRDGAPALVVLDLDNPRTDPIGLVSAWRQDPATASLAIVGFVSHVRADLIEAARSAGLTDILARSAFVQRLPEIVARGARSAAPPASRPPAEEPPFK